MTNHASRAAFRDALLRQEGNVSKTQYEEYRRKLEQSLRRAVRRERTMRMATLVTGLTALLGIPGLVVLDRLPLPIGVKDILFLILATLSGCALPFLLLYFVRYRPALQYIQRESRDDLMREMQRQIAELQKDQLRSSPDNAPKDQPENRPEAEEHEKS